jgi:antirestriction protein ArdC
MEPDMQAFQPIERCEALMTSMPQRPTLHHEEPRAYYRPLVDAINMPRPELFDSPEEYYSTLFHELTHSTGHEGRLNRATLNRPLPLREYKLLERRAGGGDGRGVPVWRLRY